MAHTLRIGSQIGPADPFWVQVREAVERNAQRLDVDLIPIDISEHPETLPPEEQASLLDELIAQELGALICWNLPDDLISRILEHHIPLIYPSETTLQHPLFVSPRGLYQAAGMMGNYLAEKLPEGGRVICIGGLIETGGENGSTRLAGIREALEARPNFVCDHVPSFWRPAEAQTQIEEGLLKPGGPIAAIFGLSDSLALAAKEIGQRLGLVNAQTLITGINGDPLALAAIAEGRMTATVETPPAEFGAQIIELACKAARREPLPTHFSFQPRLVTSENVAEISMQRLIAIADLPTRLVGVNRKQEQNRLTQLETSTAINRRVGALLERQQLSREIANLIRLNYGYDEVQVFLWSESQQKLILDQPDQDSNIKVSLNIEDSGLLGEALQRNDSIFVPDTLNSQRFPPDPKWPETRSRIVLPIRLGTKVLGLLDLHSHHLIAHLRQDLIGLQSLADQLGVAMRNAELYSEAVEARALAEKADQLKTRLLANVSHELRAPLNVILGYSHTALTQPQAYNLDLPPALRHDFELIYRSGEHLIRLINDLLDLSRAEIGALDIFPETIASRSFLEEAFRGMADTASTGEVVWRLDVPARLPVIEADPVRIRQVLLNLLSNARKFTREGEIVLGADVAPPHLHIWVQDTGMGIPIEMQEQIFEPFVTGQTSNRPGDGIGLGLSVTRRLVALHNGSMSLESQTDQGSTFHVYLPLPNLAGRPIFAGAGTAQPVLLFLSASEQPADALREISFQQGLTLHWLRPNDDLETVLRQAQPAALAWDMTMAGAEAWAMVQRLRSHPQFCQLPLILFSPDSDEPTQLASGVTNILVKPATGRTIVDTINALRPTLATEPVLIVDDDSEARSLYQRLVADALPGQPVKLAEDGEAALALLAQDVPSLVILDLNMPKVDGFAVLEYLRTNPATRLVPVLVMSGRILSLEDVQRLNYAGVTLQSKGVLSSDEAILTLQQTFSGKEKLPQPTSLLVKRAMAYLHQNYRQSITREDIAKAVGVSKNYLNEIFRQETGLSPLDCLNRFRIQQAKELLRTSSEGITAIAAQVGFEDSAYFSRVFRKIAGQSPQEYRR